MSTTQPREVLDNHVGDLPKQCLVALIKKAEGFQRFVGKPCQTVDVRFRKRE